MYVLLHILIFQISATTAGNGVYLDYSKSDLWALGTLAYEIFGSRNPFYTYNANDTPLRSRSYGDEQLPIMSGAFYIYIDNIL